MAGVLASGTVDSPAARVLPGPPPAPGRLGGDPAPPTPSPCSRKHGAAKPQHECCRNPRCPTARGDSPLAAPFPRGPSPFPVRPPFLHLGHLRLSGSRAQLTPESLPCALEPEGRLSRRLERGSPAPPPRHITARAASLLLLPRSVKKRNLPERAGPSQRPCPTGA